MKGKATMPLELLCDVVSGRGPATALCIDIKSCQDSLLRGFCFPDQSSLGGASGEHRVLRLYGSQVIVVLGGGPG